MITYRIKEVLCYTYAEAPKRSSHAQVETIHDLDVFSEILLLEIVLKATALTQKLLQPTLRGVILLVLDQVRGETLDALGEERNLQRRRAGVVGASLELRDVGVVQVGARHLVRGHDLEATTACEERREGEKREIVLPCSSSLLVLSAPPFCSSSLRFSASSRAFNSSAFARSFSAASTNAFLSALASRRASFPFCLFPTSRYTKRELISAGVTPPMRLACPTVRGVIFASFSLASMRSVVMAP